MVRRCLRLYTFVLFLVAGVHTATVADRLPTFLTIPQFLREYPVGRTRFYEEVRAGRIRILKSGARTLVPASELERLVREATLSVNDGDNHAP
jgi:hypothetical protein